MQFLRCALLLPVVAVVVQTDPVDVPAAERASSPKKRLLRPLSRHVAGFQVAPGARHPSPWSQPFAGLLRVPEIGMSADTRDPDESLEDARARRVEGFRENLRKFDGDDRSPIRETGKILVSPSVAKADVLNLEQALTEVVEAGADALHLGSQDGHFVPTENFIAPEVVRALREKFLDTLLDVKLSIAFDSPDSERRAVEDYAKAGADLVSVHPESVQYQLTPVLDQIRSHGMAAGVVMNPGTPFSVLEPLLLGEMVDVVVVMLVNPGHGEGKYPGEGSYLELALEKMRAIQRFCFFTGKTAPYIEVAGGVTPQNAELLISAGANMLVAGDSVFGAEDKAAAVSGLTKSAHRYNALQREEQANMPLPPKMVEGQAQMGGQQKPMFMPSQLDDPQMKGPQQGGQ